jgi:hypothetical protein
MKTPVTLLFLLLLPALAWAAPKVAVDRDSHQFGEIFEGVRVEHTFHFRNIGDQPLVIDRVRSSCGCTAALLSATVIAPGESGQLRTTFDSSRFRGTISKKVSFYSNDPVRPVTHFVLTGVVRPELAPERHDIDLGLLAPGEVRETRLSLSNHGDTMVNVTGVEATSPEVRASISSPILGAGGQVQLILRVQAPTDRQRLSGYLLVRTDHPRMPELRLPFYGSITAAPP